MDMANISTKPSSRDDGSVAILAISTWPVHVKSYVDIIAVLIMEHFSDNNINMYHLPPHLTTNFLPSNITSQNQPADMGMIVALKVLYNYLYLRDLLNIFDAPVGCE